MTALRERTVATAGWTAWTCRVWLAVTAPATLDDARGVLTDELADVDRACSWFDPVLAAARRTVAACPVRELRLDRRAPGARDPGRSAGRQPLPGQLTGNAQGGIPQWSP